MQDDLISRQAVINIMANTNFWLSADNWKEFMKAIDSIPSVQPQPKTGHWIALGNYDDWGNESSYKCSECGELDTYPDNYCHNCGCHMVEPQESEDK